jgi:Bacterial Ig-like domain
MAVLLIAAMALLPAGAAAVTYEPEPAFCKLQVIRDPAPPFARMPKLHQPSNGGKIGFGPPSLRLRATPSLRVGGGRVGFTLYLARQQGLNLPWTATMTVVVVNRNGRPTGVSDRIIRKVGWLKPSGKRFQVPVPDAPAFYRATILLTNAGGQRLGKLSFYTRMERTDPRARLNLNASTYHPESSVFMRVESFGNLATFYGVDYKVEKLEGSAWIEAAESPRGPVILIGLSSLPGSSGPCNRFWIPPTMAPGSYRIAKEVDFVLPFVPDDPPRRPGPPPVTLIAQFQVTA